MHAIPSPINPSDTPDKHANMPSGSDIDTLLNTPSRALSTITKVLDSPVLIDEANPITVKTIEIIKPKTKKTYVKALFLILRLKKPIYTNKLNRYTIDIICMGPVNLT